MQPIQTSKIFLAVKLFFNKGCEHPLKSLRWVMLYHTGYVRCVWGKNLRELLGETAK